MAAREVVVAALGTVYALSAVDDDAVPWPGTISVLMVQAGHWPPVCLCSFGLFMPALSHWQR